MHATARSQGIALPTSLIFLVAMTLIGLTMFKSVGMQERIASNTRDKERAFHAAQSTLKYAEGLISQGGGLPIAPCNALQSGDAASSVYACSTTLTTAQLVDAPWKPNGTDLGFTYTPRGLSVGAGNYSALPRFVAVPIGLDAGGTRLLYQVSAMATGTSGKTIAVVQSVFAVEAAVIDSGGL